MVVINTEKPKPSVAAAIATLLLATPALLFNGWAVSVMWQWFIVRVFHLAPLTVMQGVGLLLVLAVFRPSVHHTRADFSELYILLGSTVTVAFILGIGWIVQYWV